MHFFIKYFLYLAWSWLQILLLFADCILLFYAEVFFQLFYFTCFYCSCFIKFLCNCLLMIKEINSFKCQLIFLSQTEFVHIKMSEKCILCIQINFFYFFQCKNSKTVWWSMNSMSKKKAFEIFIWFILRKIFTEI